MNNKQSIAAAAAIVAGLIVSSALPASAQYRSQDGRALDANRRVGGNGSNEETGNRSGSKVTGNQVITGNVTGLRGFSGPVGYRDPSEFRGPLGTTVQDNFVRDTSGSDGRTSDLSGPRAFYGDARTTPPPPGYVPTLGANGGYVAIAPQDQGGLQSSWAGGHAGSNANEQFRNSDLGISQRFGELVLPGPAGDTTGAANVSDTYISASPLYGFRVFKYDATTGDASPSGADRGLGQGADLSPADKLGLTDRGIQRMQDELNNANNPRPRVPQQGDANATSGDGPRPVNQPVQNNANVDPSGASAPNGDLQTGGFNGSPLSPAARQRLLVAPSEQSELYRALEQMYERQNANRPPNDLEAAHQLQSLQTVQRQADAKKPGVDDNAAPGSVRKPAAGATGVGGTGTNGAAPVPRVPTRPAPTPRTGPIGADGTDSKAASAPVEPINVDSLATGVKAKGLADLLKSAEDLMKQGKFTSAIQKYELAGRVAPNNALITLGRANAELGASLYGQAENDLRRSIQSQPALLVGRYNLRGFIGEERMGYLVKDLKEISDKEAKQLRPLLLLAYIANNSGNVDQTRDYLDRGLKLASADPVLLAMRDHWTLKPSGKESGVKAATEPVASPTKPVEKTTHSTLNK